MNIRRLTALRRRTQGPKGRFLLLQATWAARKQHRKNCLQQEIADFLLAKRKAGYGKNNRLPLPGMRKVRKRPYMVSDSGQPREQEEVKSLVEGFFGNLFSSRVEDADLPMQPSTWLSPVSQLQEADRAWVSLSTWE
eukprot:1026653-Alexandrium_andersonii.AAC.1